MFTGPDMNLANGIEGEEFGVGSYIFGANNPLSFTDAMGLENSWAHKVDIWIWKKLGLKRQIAAAEAVYAEHLAEKEAASGVYIQAAPRVGSGPTAILSADRSGEAFIANQATLGNYELGSPIAEGMATLPIEIPASIMCPEMAYLYFAANLHTLADKNASSDMKTLALVGVMLHKSPGRGGITDFGRFKGFAKELKELGIEKTQRREILQNIRDNFTKYDEVQIRRIDRDRSFWRRWDDVKADEIGHYGSIGPRTESYSRYLLSICSDWNSLKNQTRLRIRKGGLVVEGPAAPKIDIDGAVLPGSGHQLYVPNKSDLFIP